MGLAELGPGLCLPVASLSIWAVPLGRPRPALSGWALGPCSLSGECTSSLGAYLQPDWAISVP